MDGRTEEERRELIARAERLEERAEREREAENVTYSEHLERQARHCRRLARE